MFVKTKKNYVQMCRKGPSPTLMCGQGQFKIK